MVIGRNRQWQELKAGFEGIVRLVKYYKNEGGYNSVRIGIVEAKIDQTDDEVNPTEP